MSAERHEYVRVVSYPCEAMFDLVADVEHYPAFVPGFRDARVLRREGDILHVHQSFGFGPAHYSFNSIAEFVRPDSIEISPASELDPGFGMRWEFVPHGAGCEVKLQVWHQGGGLLGELVSLLPVNVILSAFVARADALYGE